MGKTFADLGAAEAFLAAAADDGFGLVTMHRPSNVDDPAKLAVFLQTLARIAEKLPLVFPMHPRTRSTIAGAGLEKLFDGVPILPSAPLSYLRLIGLMREARVVVTDSGGIQEETTALGIPCLTVRENTERPITTEEGTNTLIGTNPADLIVAVDAVLANGGKKGRIPQLWTERLSADCGCHIEIHAGAPVQLTFSEPTCRSPRFWGAALCSIRLETSFIHARLHRRASL